VAVGSELVDAKTVKEAAFDIIENRAHQLPGGYRQGAVGNARLKAC